MRDEMHVLLNAYWDGELHGESLHRFEDHLTACEECRKGLEELEKLSVLLHASTAPAKVSADRFVSNLTLSLPRRPVKEQSSRRASWVWWAVPTGLLFIWFFLQAVGFLSSAVSLASRADLLGSVSSLFQGGPGHSLWFSALSGLVGSQTGSTLSAFSFLDEVSVFGFDTLTWFLLQAGIILLYWSWLAAWWVFHQPRGLRGSPSLPPASI